MNNKLGRGRDNNERLHRTMSNYGISRRWVSTQLCVNLSTVDRWLQPKHKTTLGGRNPSYRSMPDAALKLFKYCLNDDAVVNKGLFRNPPDDVELIPRGNR